MREFKSDIKEFRNLYTSSDIIRMIKTRGCDGRTYSMNGSVKTHIKLYSENLNGRPRRKWEDDLKTHLK
jgi:hypothetical protein